MLARLLCLALAVLPLVAHAQGTDLRIVATVRPPGNPGAQQPVALLDVVVENVGATTATTYLQIHFPQSIPPRPPCYVIGGSPDGSVCRLNSQTGSLCDLNPLNCLDLGTFAPGARLACTFTVTRTDPACPAETYRLVTTDGGADATPANNFVDVVFGFASPVAVPNAGSTALILVALVLLAVGLRRERARALVRTGQRGKAYLPRGAFHKES